MPSSALAALLGDTAAFHQPPSRMAAHLKCAGVPPSTHSLPASPRGALHVARALHLAGVTLRTAEEEETAPREQLSPEELLQQLDALDMGLVEVVRMLTPARATKPVALLLEQLRRRQAELTARLARAAARAPRAGGSPLAARAPTDAAEACGSPPSPPAGACASLLGSPAPRAAGQPSDAVAAGEREADRESVSAAIARKALPPPGAGSSAVAPASPEPQLAAVCAPEATRFASASAAQYPEGSYAALATEEIRNHAARNPGQARSARADAPTPVEKKEKQQEVMGSRPRDPLDLGMSIEEWKEEQAQAARAFVKMRLAKKQELERRAEAERNAVASRVGANAFESEREYLRSLAQATRQHAENDVRRREESELEVGEPVLGALKGEQKWRYSIVTDEFDKAIEIRLQILLPSDRSTVEPGSDIRLTLGRASGGGVALPDGDLSAITDDSGLAIVTCGREYVRPGRWIVWLDGRGAKRKKYQITFSTVRSSAELELARSLQELQLSQRQAEAELKHKEELLHKMQRFGRIFDQIPHSPKSKATVAFNCDTVDAGTHSSPKVKEASTPKRMIAFREDTFLQRRTANAHLEVETPPQPSRAASVCSVVEAGSDRAHADNTPAANNTGPSGGMNRHFSNVTDANSEIGHHRAEEVASPLVRSLLRSAVPLPSLTDGEMLAPELAWSLVTIMLYSRLCRRALAQPLPLFTYRFLVRLFGSREEARLRLPQLRRTLLLCRYAPAESRWAPRLRMFARLLGEYEPLPNDCEQVYLRLFHLLKSYAVASDKGEPVASPRRGVLASSAKPTQIFSQAVPLKVASGALKDVLSHLPRGDVQAVLMRKLLGMLKQGQAVRKVDISEAPPPPDTPKPPGPVRSPSRFSKRASQRKMHLKKSNSRGNSIAAERAGSSRSHHDLESASHSEAAVDDSAGWVDFDQVLRLAVEEQLRFRDKEMARVQNAFAARALEHGVQVEGESQLSLHEFIEFVAHDLPSHMKESDAIIAFTSAAEAQERGVQQQRFFTPQVAMESVSWEHASRELIALGMLSSPVNGDWVNSLPDATPDPAPAELSADTLQLAWSEYSKAIAPQLKRWGSSHGVAHATTSAVPQDPKPPTLIATRSKAAFSVILDSGDTETIRMVSRFDREVENGTIDPNMGWTQMRRLLCCMAVTAATLPADALL